ncbi:MAG TPA: UDP-glucose 4-epimerase GalE [Elusimicrobia bacterium]|nr:UDP-glucose 4-epimerase GalE [Elusimicrobiota bacterium]HCE99172.1 UDP-glucose 4-epimerase GalE [Elusimicrobiota bacterium]
MEHKILVTGGAGYIGSHACKALAGSGYTPVVFDNLSTGHRELVKWGGFFKGDLSDKEAILSCLKKYRPAAVMHFAAYAAVGESVVNPARYYSNNVVNTLNLLDAMRSRGVDKFIFSSSCAVYGLPRSLPINEDQPLEPVNPYGRTKRMVEEILSDYSAAYGMKYASLRYFNAAGADPDGETGEAHNPETHIIPLTLAAAMGKTPFVEIFGADYKTPDGTCLRDYVHVTDLAAAHLLALKLLMKNGKNLVLNLGNGRGFSVKEVVETARLVTGKKVKAVIRARRSGDPAELVASQAMARRVLGWKPRYTRLADIIRTAWQWHRKAISLRLNDCHKP